MVNILGPFDQADFRTMGMLKNSIAWYKQQPDPIPYRNALDKETAILQDYMRGAYSAGASQPLVNNGKDIC